MAKTKHTDSDLRFALLMAADFLESEEWPEPKEREAVEAAYKEGSSRLRAMAKRLEQKMAKSSNAEITGADRRPG